MEKLYKNEPEAQVRQNERKKAPKTPPKKQTKEVEQESEEGEAEEEGEPAEGKETLSKAETRMKMDSDSHSSLRFFDITKTFQILFENSQNQD